MRVLSLDVSTKTGWARFDDGKYISSGAISQIKVEDFNVNADPNLSSKYPHNVMAGAEAVSKTLVELWHQNNPDVVVCENTNKGRNRHTQRLLEWIHFCMCRDLFPLGPLIYMDSSEWRRLVEMKLSKDQKKNNRDVSAGKKRGRIGKKHLSVNMVNEKFGLKLKLKDNDQADACLLGLAYVIRHKLPETKTE